jgi:electron transfer flavoprotein beta subunit
MSKNIVLCLKPINTRLLEMANKTEQDPFQMNPYDCMALKNLVSLKNTNNDIKIICVCMGSKSAECILRRAIALGADETYLVSDRLFAGSDTVATTYILSEAIKKFDNIIAIVCGVKSIDGETGQVPQGLGERLGIHRVISADEVTAISDSDINYKRIDDYKIYLMQTKLPVIIRYNSFKTEPDNISLMALKRAKKKEIHYLNAEDLYTDTMRCGLKGSRTKVRETSNRFEKKDKIIINGTVAEIAKSIKSIIENGKVVEV